MLHYPTFLDFKEDTAKVNWCRNTIIIVPMSVTYNKPLTERLLCLYHKDYKDLLTVDLFSVYLLPHVDCNSLYRGRFYVWASGLCSLYRRIRYIEVRYIEVLFHTFYCNFGPDIEYSSLYRGLRQLNRGSLNRGATVLPTHFLHTTNIFNFLLFWNSLYVYTRGILGCLLGFWPLGQNPAGAQKFDSKITLSIWSLEGCYSISGLMDSLTILK